MLKKRILFPLLITLLALPVVQAFVVDDMGAMEKGHVMMPGCDNTAEGFCPDRDCCSSGLHTHCDFGGSLALLGSRSAFTDGQRTVHFAIDKQYSLLLPDILLRPPKNFPM